LAHVRTGSNPHLFYDPVAAATLVAALDVQLERRHVAGVAQRYRLVRAQLMALSARATHVATVCPGLRFAATEDVATRLLSAMGARVVTPLALRQAVGNGVDPTVSDLATALDQLARRPVALVENAQTATPLTNEMVSAARAHHVPVVTVRETLRPGTSYVTFLGHALSSFEHVARQRGCRA
jgi:zinc/manganese transport system substrate-binding protein